MSLVALSHLGITFDDATRAFRWPRQAVLAFPGLIKMSAKDYPAEVGRTLKNQKYRVGPNVPAVYAYEVCGRGEKPRFLEVPPISIYSGYTVGAQQYEEICRESWHIHHIYGEYCGFKSNLDGKHFTQSAGLVAVCPPVHGLAEYEPLLWDFLWRQAYERFGYDPLMRFSKSIDDWGFDPTRGSCQIGSLDSESSDTTEH